MKALRGLVIKLFIIAAVLGGGYLALTSSEVKELSIADARGDAQCALFKATGVLTAENVLSLQGKEGDVVGKGSVWTLPITVPPVYVVDTSDDFMLTPGYCYFSTAEQAQAALDNPVSLDDSSGKSLSGNSTAGALEEPAAKDATGVVLMPKDDGSGAPNPKTAPNVPTAFFDQEVTTPSGYLLMAIVLILLSIVLTLLYNNVRRGKITFFWDFEFQALKSDASAKEPLRRVSGGQGKVRVSVVLSVQDPSNPNAWLSAMTVARKDDLETQIRTVLFALLKAELEELYLDEIMKMLGKSLAVKLSADKTLLALCSEQLVALELIAFNTPEMAEVTRSAWKGILDLTAELARIEALRGAGLEPEHIGAYEQGRGLGEMGRGINTGAAVLGEYLDDKTKSAGS